MSLGVQTELIPGYKLLKRLGQGGFGEVWKAEAPGGLLKAVKIVYGDVHAKEGDKLLTARQELKALDRVKSVRHPFILSLERYDIIDGQLVIVMELADKDLGDRFKECRAQGLPGIPRDELLRYMGETAEALDLMNIEHQLQHLDIKPQNLFLVYNHVKVADFGLVKDLEGMRTQMTSGMTALYAPPETFEGLVSRYCDQYNLAIVYQELLTGQLPFKGTNQRQLMLQHLTAAPDLRPLPPGDREAVGRALAKNPEDRHPSCADFVHALRGSVPAALPIATPAPPDAEPIRPTPAPPTSVSPPPASAGPTPIESGKGDTLPQKVRFPRVVPPPPPPMPETPLPPEPPEVTGDGTLFPALVVGLGVAGREILRHLRKGLHKRCGADRLPNVRFLLVDADPEELREATQGEADTALRESETFLTRLQRPANYLKQGTERQSLERWLNMNLLTRLPRDQTMPGGWRILGRLALASNYTTFATRVRAELEACTRAEALAAAQRRTSLGLRSNRPRVYVVASLAGGTGGGMFLDTAYALRHALKQLGYRDPDVVGLFLVPGVETNGERARSTANAYGALSELRYFMGVNTAFAADYPDRSSLPPDRAPPFRRCVLLPLPKHEQPASLQELAALAGDYLGRELTTPLARVAEECRAAAAKDHALTRRTAVPTVATFGSFWFVVPRRLLLQRVAQSLCYELVQTWRAQSSADLDGSLRAWVQEQASGWNLAPEQLRPELQRVVGAAEAKVDEVLAPYGTNQPANLRRHPKLFAEALDALEALVGDPKSGLAVAAHSAWGKGLDKAVAALSCDLENRLAEVALRVLAEPHFRLLGVEELVQARVNDFLGKQAADQRAEAEELLRAAAAVYPRVGPVLEALHRGSLWGWGKKTQAAAELLDLLRQYGSVRTRMLEAQALAVLYQNLQVAFHRHQRKVACCRRRIAQFLNGFEATAASRQTPVDLGLGQYLLPAGCRSLNEAVAKILASLTPQELAETNERVIALIGRKFEDQVHVCTAPAGFFKELEEDVLREVTAFAEAPLGRAHAAEMYMEQRGRDDTVLADLAGAFAEACPELAGARLDPDSELCIVAVPAGAEGDYFRTLVGQALPDRPLVPAASTDDIVFYREVPHLPLASLPQLGPAAEQAYRQFLDADQFPPHSRMDITNWTPPDLTG